MYRYVSGNRNNPMILFLHADGSSGKMWKKHFATFKNYYCVAPDLPGFGKSGDTPWTTLEEVTDSIKDLILESPHRKAHVVGLSLGGSVAINLLGKYSQYIDRAVIDGAGVLPIKGVRFIKAGVAVVSPFIHKDFVIKIIAKSLGLKKQDDIKDFTEGMKSSDPYSFRTAFAQANDQLEPQVIHKVAVPTLFVAGEKEGAETIKSGIILSKKMPNAASYIVPGMGHGWIGMAPELHAQMTKAWLEGKSLPDAFINMS